MTPWMSSYNKILYLDLETYSDVDITRGVYKYSSSKNFEILLCSYAFNEEEVKVFSPLKDEIPLEFIEAIKDEKILKVAHNAIFERVCLSRFLLKNNYEYLNPKSWCCTLILASILGLPKSLDGVCKYFGLSAKEAKAKTLGTRLINFFSKPIEPKRTNNFRNRNYPENDPEKRSDFCFYNKQDVISLRVIFKKLIKLVSDETLNHEFPLYELDQKINDLGVRVDMDFIDSVLEFLEEDTANSINELKRLTGLENPNSRNQLLDFLHSFDSKLSKVNDLTKETVKNLISEFSAKNDAKSQQISRILTLVQAIKKTSNAKYVAMKESAILEKDGTYRCHGTTQFYTAVTGRWGGRIVQVQNLVRNSLKNIKDVREIVKERDFESLEMLFDNPTQVISELVRTCFIPSENARFIVCDYNAIESRVAAWLSDEKWKIKAFIEGKGIYEETASKMFKVPASEITHDSPLRAKGKVAELAGQYQGGLGAYKAMGADKLGLTDEEIKELVYSWRRENSSICEMRETLETTIKDVIKAGRLSIFPKKIEVPIKIGIDKKDELKISFKNSTLYIALPSGRNLTYPKADVKVTFNKLLNKNVEKIAYEGDSRTSVNREEIAMYGGKFFENIVQAIARDCLAEAMLALNKNGFTPVFHVHDEVIISVDYSLIKDDKEAIRVISEIMEKAAGNYNSKIPLRAAGYSCEFYLKD